MKKRIGFNVGTLLPINEVLKFCKNIEQKKHNNLSDENFLLDSFWIPESWGREAFCSLGAISQVTKKTKLGSAIISIHSRTPATSAMAITTLDILSNNRSILGLGVSTPALVENWHGIKFDNPFEKMTEYVECIRQIMTGNNVTYNGKYFKINNFKILFKPPRVNIPIFTAAVNKKMIDLSCNLSDGVLLYLRPKHELPNTVSYIQSKLKDNNKQNFEIACSFITSVSNEFPEKARQRVAKTLAFYVAVGKYYRRFLENSGFREDVALIYDEYSKNGLHNLENFVSDKMLDALTIYGTREDCIKSLNDFMKSGISLPIIQINPADVNNPESSIKDLLLTF
ncbi:MAG: LLM class flavin-dependent oxidoreductase [Nitrososphaeraceae archaeon]